MENRAHIETLLDTNKTCIGYRLVSFEGILIDQFKFDRYGGDRAKAHQDAEYARDMWNICFNLTKDLDKSS